MTHCKFRGRVCDHAYRCGLLGETVDLNKLNVPYGMQAHPKIVNFGKKKLEIADLVSFW